MKSPLHKTTRWLLLGTAGIIVITSLAWLLGTDPKLPGETTGAARDALEPWRILLMVGRWVCWGLLWWQWDRLGKALFKDDSPNAMAQRSQWQAMRHRMMGGIAVVEVFILLSNRVGA